MMWVYLKTGESCYTVGFYSPDGEWHHHDDFSTRNDAASWVSFLNGGVRP